MPLSVAVIGAGLAGLTCARRLQDAGVLVTLFEKSRGLGGRLATRRVEEGLRFDHGAQFVTAEGSAFGAVLTSLEAAGAVAAWTPKVEGPRAVPNGRAWWVGTPGMNALVRPLADGLDIRLNTRVSALQQTAGGWQLGLSGQDAAGPFDRLVLAIPPAQAAELLAGRPEAEALSPIRVAPCWAVMLAFELPLDAGFDVWQGQEGPLAWAARNASKPGWEGRPETWILHAGPDWSAENLEVEPGEILAQLTAAFGERVGPLPPNCYATAHRWRYARTVAPLGRPFLAAERLFVGGDWCLGARVEAAHDSGLAMASALLGETA